MIEKSYIMNRMEYETLETIADRITNDLIPYKGSIRSGVVYIQTKLNDNVNSINGLTRFRGKDNSYLLKNYIPNQLIFDTVRCLRKHKNNNRIKLRKKIKKRIRQMLLYKYSYFLLNNPEYDETILGMILSSEHVTDEIYNDVFINKKCKIEVNFNYINVKDGSMVFTLNLIDNKGLPIQKLDTVYLPRRRNSFVSLYNEYRHLEQVESSTNIITFSNYTKKYKHDKSNNLKIYSQIILKWKGDII